MHQRRQQGGLRRAVGRPRGGVEPYEHQRDDERKLQGERRGDESARDRSSRGRRGKYALAPVRVGELRRHEPGDGGRKEAEADERDQQGTAHRVGVDRNRRAENPLPDGQRGERGDHSPDRHVVDCSVGQPDLDAVPYPHPGVRIGSRL